MDLRGTTAVITGGAGGIGGAMGRAGARVFLGLRHVLPVMLAQRSGSIVNTVLPGMIDTAMLAEVTSDAASLVNGVAWPVDGGILGTLPTAKPQ